MIAPLIVALALGAAAKPNASFQPKNRPYDAISYRLEVKLSEDDAFNNKLTLVLKPKKALVLAKGTPLSPQQERAGFSQIVLKGRGTVQVTQHFHAPTRPSQAMNDARSGARYLN